MHGTSRPNVIAPVNECTIAVECVHRKLRVVDGQRSGAPKISNSAARVSASYSRRAGSKLICAVSEIA